jgi:RNA polymerase sigma-70 factor (ECF subfamily)
LTGAPTAGTAVTANPLRATHATRHTREKNLESRASLDCFLAGVERRAFRMAQFATGNRDEALDIVQDAMLALARHYGGRMPDEWGPLFHRILQSRIRDWYRRQHTQHRWLAWLGTNNDDDEDPLAALPDPDARRPEEQLGNTRAGVALETALGTLPLRQQQAFLLRTWEGLDVAATAAAMGCSEGSVKTHYSRAVHALRAQLEDHWP